MYWPARRFDHLQLIEGDVRGRGLVKAHRLVFLGTNIEFPLDIHDSVRRRQQGWHVSLGSTSMLLGDSTQSDRNRVPFERSCTCKHLIALGQGFAGQWRVMRIDKSRKCEFESRSSSRSLPHSTVSKALAYLRSLRVPSEAVADRPSRQSAAYTIICSHSSSSSTTGAHARATSLPPKQAPST